MRAANGRVRELSGEGGEGVHDFLAAEWLPAIAATGTLAANIIARMAAPARLDGGRSLSVDVTGGH